MSGCCAVPIASTAAGVAAALRISCELSQNVTRLQMTLGQRRRPWCFGKSTSDGRSWSSRCGDFSRRSFRASNRASLGGQSVGSVLAEEVSVPQFEWWDVKGPRICVLGGGFGGLYTALRLESLIWAPDKRPQVLLIDQSDRFVFKPLLYEILSKEVDQWEIAPLFTELLSNTSIKFIKDSVKSVSPSDFINGHNSPASSSKGIGGSVFLSSGLQIDYDWLVLALGSESRLNLVPGTLEFALPFATLEDALEVDQRLSALEQQKSGPEITPIEVVIVGSGYCGVELAATLAERLGKRGKIQIVDPGAEICASAPAGNRVVASKVLSSRDVQLELGYFVSSIRDSKVCGMTSEDNGTASAHADTNKLIIDLKLATQRPSRRNTGGRELTADIVLWTVGTKATVPAGLNGDYMPFPVNGRGQVDTDETLRVKGHPRIFAIGDSAGIKDSSGRLLPTTAQVAFQQADYAGWNLWAAINNRPLLPFRYQHLGEMMTLGKSDAAVSVGFIENLTLDGLLAHSARRLAYLYRLPQNDHKAKVAMSWLAKSTINAISFIQDELTNILSTR